MKVGAPIRLLEEDGPSLDVPAGMLNAILKQAGLRKAGGGG